MALCSCHDNRKYMWQIRGKFNNLQNSGSALALNIFVHFLFVVSLRNTKQQQHEMTQRKREQFFITNFWLTLKTILANKYSFNLHLGRH